MAFQRDLDHLYRDAQEKETITIGVFDLNDLKEINDPYGHKYGDSAIINAYDTLKEVFSDHGTCYRIGGDEFACFLELKNNETIKELKERVNKRVKEKKEGLSYPFVIAQGYSILPVDEIMSVDQIIHRADQDMYKDKELKKKFVIKRKDL